LLFFQDAVAEEPKKIALFPFEVNSPGESNLIRQNISEGLIRGFSRSKQIRIIDPQQYLDLIKDKAPDEGLARSVGGQIGADYVLTGGAFRIGDTLSLDARVVDIKGGKTLQDFYTQGKGGVSDSSRIAAELAAKVLTAVLGKKKVSRIVFKGNRKIEATAIQNVIKISKGRIYSDEELSNDIKAIYKMSYFNDVQVDVADSPEGPVVTFIVDEKPLISQIRIKGNDAVSTKDIEAVLSTKPKQFVDADRLRNDAEKVRDLFLNKGYLNVEVKYDSEKRDKDIIVNFNITEGDRLYIKTITFEGNHAFSDKQLKKLMETNEKGFFSVFTDSGLLKKEKLKEDGNRINAFYLNNGYINAKVGEAEITNDKKWIYVKITITEGKRFKVGKVTVSGDPLSISKEKILEKLKINKKDYYDRESVVKDIDDFTQAANDEGFAYAEVTPNVVPVEATQTVDVNYNLTKGDKVFFNRIEISGNTKTRDKIIRRQISIVEGDLFSRGKLKESYNRLNRLRYFDEIDFQTEKGPDKDLMDVMIKVKEKPTGMFSIGAGYSAQDKAMIMAQISQQNLFGRGQSLGVNASLGASSSTYNLFFIEPFLFDMPLWSKYELWRIYKEYDTYDLTSRGFGGTFGYPIWERILGYIGYRYAVNDISNVSDSASSYVKDEEGKISSSGLTLTLSRDTTDDSMFPTKGTRNSLSVEYTGGFLGGDTGYTKYMGVSTWFHPLPLESVFGLRGRIGYMEGREGSEIPVYDRFYLGGINSLRGLRNVGPIDPETGDVIGGTTMLNFNVEIVFPLIKSAGMKGVVFFDTGNAWDDGGYHLNDMRKTAGLGIRWYSPIGPLRLEWGYVLDRKDDEAASRFEFTIGFFM
jgi:outer membrane protein insertion porin family